MSHLKCIDCTEFKECKILAKFQEEAENFMDNDKFHDSCMAADKKVDDCVDFKRMEE